MQELENIHSFNYRDPRDAQAIQMGFFKIIDYEKNPIITLLDYHLPTSKEYKKELQEIKENDCPWCDCPRTFPLFDTVQDYPSVLFYHLLDTLGFYDNCKIKQVIPTKEYKLNKFEKVRIFDCESHILENHTLKTLRYKMINVGCIFGRLDLYATLKPKQLLEICLHTHLSDKKDAQKRVSSVYKKVRLC